MQYCLYNAIRTPDGTVLWCQHRWDYQVHEDQVSNEIYMNDGVGYYTRRSVNGVPYEDLSVWVDDTYLVITDEVRGAKFWGTYGKDGKQERKVISMKEMSDEHLDAILETQKHIEGTIFHKLFLLEKDFRKEQHV